MKGEARLLLEKAADSLAETLELGERPGAATPVAALLVCACMAASVRARFVRPALPVVAVADAQGGMA